MNTALKKWNDLEFTIPALGRSFDKPAWLGGGTVTVGWPQLSLGTPNVALIQELPKFSVAGADVGGIFTQPSLAAIAEGGKPEVVFPLSRLPEFTRAMDGGEGGGKTENHFHGDFYGWDDFVTKVGEAGLDLDLRGLQRQVAGIG